MPDSIYRGGFEGLPLLYRAAATPHPPMDEPPGSPTLSSSGFTYGGITDCPRLMIGHNASNINGAGARAPVTSKHGQSVADADGKIVIGDVNLLKKFSLNTGVTNEKAVPVLDMAFGATDAFDGSGGYTDLLLWAILNTLGLNWQDGGDRELTAQVGMMAIAHTTGPVITTSQSSIAAAAGAVLSWHNVLFSIAGTSYRSRLRSIAIQASNNYTRQTTRHDYGADNYLSATSYAFHPGMQTINSLSLGLYDRWPSDLMDGEFGPIVLTGSNVAAGGTKSLVITIDAARMNDLTRAQAEADGIMTWDETNVARGLSFS